MKRAVFVLGTGRSGTSAVALMLEALGVFIGDEFTPADRNNEWGTGEDKEWMDANRAVLKGARPAEAFGSLLEERKWWETWGAKDPAFARTLTEAIAALAEVESDREPLVVVCRRDKAATINSFMRAYQSGRRAAEDWYAQASLNVAARLGEFRGRVLEVWWEDVRADPQTTARRLAEFAGVGENKTQAAAGIIQAEMPTVRGFGDIGIGVRIASHPAVPFFVSWTMLLTGGVRAGDKVLMPRAHGPAHHSATHLARDFLQTNCDTLLMVDDDMVFEGQQLEKMRECKANWEYDAVMAFATHRTHPPKPVMLHWQGPADTSTGQYSYYLPPPEKQGAVEVDAVGLAFTLIRRRVLEAMMGDLPLDRFFPFAYGRGWESDDIPFSSRCREMGFRMAIDTENDIGHCGCHAYGWDDYVEWQATLTDVDRAKMEGREPESDKVDVEGDDIARLLRLVAEAKVAGPDDQSEALAMLTAIGGNR